MKIIKINLDFLEDLYASGLTLTTAEIFRFSSEELEKGNLVVFSRAKKENQIKNSFFVKDNAAEKKFRLLIT